MRGYLLFLNPFIAFSYGDLDSQEDIEKESSSDKEQRDKEEFSSEEEQDSTETGSDSGETTGVTPSPSGEPEDEQDSESTEASASLTDKENSTLLVLNGTGKAGVAAYWKEQLEEDGYVNVIPATYNLPVEEKTVIYTEEPEKAQALLEQFPNADFSEGKIQSGIEPAEGYPVPEECEIYIVIGQQDARSE